MRARDFVTERKKRKKKSLKAAIWGPGPYGMYGWDTGYSGDGGIGEQLDKPTPSLKNICKKHNVDLNYLKKQLQVGIQIEFEHTNDKSTAKEIALDHLSEKPDYYEKLKSVEEGWKDWVAGAALGAAALGANAEIVKVMPGQTVYSIAKAMGTTPEAIQKANKLDKNFTVKAGQELKIPGVKFTDVPTASKKQSATPTPDKKIDTSKTLTGTTHEAVLTKTARAAGITDPIELAALLAQCAHETHDFKSLVEYGGSLDFRKYDIKFNPSKAKELGNTRPGDGARYKGRGYIQLTGKYNYGRAGKALGLDLVKNPELVERPDVAAKVAVWYWKNRVQPKVDDFNNVAAVTKPINSGLRGLEDRKEAFIDFKRFKLTKTKT